MLPRNRTLQRLDCALADRKGISTDCLCVRGAVRLCERSVWESSEGKAAHRWAGENQVTGLGV